jgi:hypothetical protein
VLVGEATDTGLTNGTPYGYRVAAVFLGPDGKERATDGVGVVATPVALPSAVTGLIVKRTGGGGYEVTWPGTPTGEVRVYRVADPRAVPFRLGEQLPVTDLDKLGKRVPAAGTNAARDRADGLNALHLFPVTVHGQAAVAGQVVTENWVDDVTHLRVWADGDALRATWNFPDGFDTAVVLFRPDQYPDGPDDATARRAVWTREQARLNGGFRTAVPDAQRAFVTVFTQVNRDGRWQFSSGVRVEVAVGMRRRVRWALRRQRKWLVPTGTWELVVTPEAPTDLPELLLIASPDGYPLNPSKGHEVARAGATAAGPGAPVVVAFEPPSWFDPKNARVFPWADDDNRWLELVG